MSRSPTLYQPQAPDIRIEADIYQFGLLHYITGGVAALAYGDPRTTRDLDLVIAIDSSKLQTLVNALEAAGFYCPPLAVEAVQAGRETILSVTHSELILNYEIIVISFCRRYMMSLQFK